MLSNHTGLLSSIPGVIDDVGISQIKYPRNNLRKKEPSVSDLIKSIRENGLLQPILVRPKGEYYEIVAGNRRCRACEMLRWRKITCHIVELDDRSAFECSIVENIQRETLSVIEEAEAFKTYVTDFGWGGISELAKKIGKSPSYITKKIKLLDMPPEVINSIINNSLNSSLAEEISSVKDSSKQSELASLITRRHLSLRKTRELVNQFRDSEEESSTFSNQEITLQRRQKAFDKMILIVRIALNSAGQLIDTFEDDWFIREALMQHRTTLHGLIDLLIKEKYKLDHRSFIA